MLLFKQLLGIYACQWTLCRSRLYITESIAFSHEFFRSTLKIPEWKEMGNPYRFARKMKKGM